MIATITVSYDEHQISHDMIASALEEILGVVTYSVKVKRDDILTLDEQSSVVWKKDRAIKLSTTEYKILEYMMSVPKKPIHRDELLEHIWGYREDDHTTNLIQVAINGLRAKIEDDPRHPKYIVTRFGFGSYYYIP